MKINQNTIHDIAEIVEVGAKLSPKFSFQKEDENGFVKVDINLLKPKTELVKVSVNITGNDIVNVFKNLGGLFHENK